MYKDSIISIGLVQLSSDDNIKENIRLSSQYIDKLAKDGANIVFLPENAFYMRRESVSKDDSLKDFKRYCMAEHPGVLAAQDWARQHCLWVVIGSIAPKESPEQALPYNRCVVVNPQGELAGYYDKLHLFDVTLADGESYLESARIQPGDQAVLVDMPWGGLGLSICYDVRFPHLYRDLALAGANMLSIPAAFTVPTGKAHWEVLLRARAIETGSFVIAAAQCGEHPGGRLSYGHSMVVNPWGEVLCDLGEEPGCALVEVDLAEVAKARRTIPSLKNDRKYSLR